MIIKFTKRHSTEIAFEVEIGDEYASQPYAKQRGVAIVKALSEKKDLRGIHLDDSDLSGCDLSGCDLSGSSLRACDLRASDLRNCDLHDCDLRFTDMRSSDLSRCDLSRSDLNECDLRCCDLSDCNLSHSDLSDCDLRSCDLRSCDLRHSELSGCGLRDCRLRDCDTRGCGLSVLLTDGWTVYIQKEYIRIDIWHHTAAEWFAFEDDDVADMAYGALAWWKKWKPVIKAAHEAILEGELA